MSIKIYTYIVVILGIILDIWLWQGYGYNYTISYTYLNWAKSYPIIMAPPFVLVGHLFWPQYIYVEKKADV